MKTMHIFGSEKMSTALGIDGSQVGVAVIIRESQLNDS